MARKSRLILAGHAHLVVLRALADLRPFEAARDREMFLRAMRDADSAAPVQLHAWALLPREARLLIRPLEPTALSRWVQAIGRRYVSAYNRVHSRTGTLWSGRFGCSVVEPGEATLQSMIFVDGSAAEEEALTSASRNSKAAGVLIHDPPEYWSLGNTPFDRERAYVGMLSERLPPSVSSQIERCLRGGWPFGSAAFLGAITLKQPGRAAPRPRGRPRRTSVDMSPNIENQKKLTY